ncbi:uncharacterized protein LOC128194227 [Vigna angularis]|uniref:uncharacterized protein LOC128194227 n=1 Tax=Phaseolus angularis TaxID=3914 RepID=UPI0022B34CA0|nr:uncharacterized protein LOC128194227 [Vigna angularis]
MRKMIAVCSAPTKTLCRLNTFCLQTDQLPVSIGKRPARCTAVALSVATGLLGACNPRTVVRIIALVWVNEGPSSVGVAEIKVAVEKTGSRVVLSEIFGHSVLKDSFKRVF